MAEPKIKTERGPERLNSPVDDSGPWPYENNVGGLTETVTAIQPPRDPAGWLPKE